MNFKRMGAAVFVLACLASLLLLGLVLAHWERARRLDTNTPLLSLQATATKSKLNQFSSSTTSGSSDSRLLTGDALLLDEGPSRFTSRIAQLLRSSLLESGVIRSVTVHRVQPTESGANGAVGTLGTSPAFFLRLSDRNLQIGGMAALSVKGSIRLSMGTTPWASSHSYQTTDTPPRLAFAWSSLVETDLEVQGIAPDREEIAAREIAGKLSEAVTKQLQELQKKHSVMPELPASFIGEYRPAPALELPPGLISHPAISYSGLLTHNATFWKFLLNEDPAAMFEKIRSSLEGAGWKVADFSVNEALYLRADRGVSTVAIFPEGNSGLVEQPRAASGMYVVEYEERFTEEERKAAIDQLIATGNVEAIWVFERMMTKDQRELLLRMPAGTPAQLLQFARLQRQQKNDAEALKALERAVAMLSVQFNESGLTEEIRKELKNLTGKDELPTITEQTLKDAGFAEILSGAEPNVTEKRANEPAYFFYRQKNGKVRTFLIRVRPASGAMDTALEFVAASGGGKSSSTRGGTKDQNGKWRCDLSDSFDSVRVSGFAEETEKEGVYRLSARLVDDWAESSGQ